jgi:hypothetical protein
MKTLLLSLILAGASLTSGASHAREKVESYDRSAHIQMMPTTPMFPTSAQECERYSKRVEQIVTEIATAHDSCLQVESSQPVAGLRSADSKSSCSHAACQRLHDARDEFRKKGQERAAQCSADFAKYQREEEKEVATKRDRRTRDAQTNPCIRDWLQYEGMCVGPAENRDDVKNCSNELNRLRASCPISDR